MNLVKANWMTLKVCGVRNFTRKQYRQIYNGFKLDDLTEEQVRVYAKTDISSQRMKFCRNVLAKDFSTEEMDEWLSLNLEGCIFQCAIEGRMHGIPKERVKEFTELKLPLNEAFEIYRRMLAEYSKA